PSLSLFQEIFKQKALVQSGNTCIRNSRRYSSSSGNRFQCKTFFCEKNSEAAFDQFSFSKCPFSNFCFCLCSYNFPYERMRRSLCLFSQRKIKFIQFGIRKICTASIFTV